MKLTSNDSFWRVRGGLPATYPGLDHDEQCDVVVVGGGLSGAVIARELRDAGLDVVVVDRREIGFGSTSGATAMLQYEIDTHLIELAETVGRDHAVRAYRLCYEAVETMERLAKRVGDDTFERAPSLYLASTEGDVPILRQEASARRAEGMDATFIGPSEIAALIPTKAPGAIISTRGAKFDPFMLTHRIFADVQRDGVRVYDRTEITSSAPHDGGIALATDRGPTIRARRAVYATGFESQSILDQKIVRLSSTWAVVTEPLDIEMPYLLWESARPYLYMRTTDDGRLLVGGEDERFRNDKARDKLIEKKAETLLGKAAAVLKIPEPEASFAWAGTFGETADGLPYIGASDEHPGALFACCFGGNGFVFAAIAAGIIRDMIIAGGSPDAEVFAFDRSH